MPFDVLPLHMKNLLDVPNNRHLFRDNIAYFFLIGFLGIRQATEHFYNGISPGLSDSVSQFFFSASQKKWQDFGELIDYHLPAAVGRGSNKSRTLQQHFRYH